MPNLNEVIYSVAFETKLDALSLKTFFRSAANIKLFINPIAILVVVLVGFIFTELNTSVKNLNSSLALFSGELKGISGEVKEIRDISLKAYNQSVLNKESIVRLVEQKLISDSKEGK